MKKEQDQEKQILFRGILIAVFVTAVVIFAVQWAGGGGTLFSQKEEKSYQRTVYDLSEASRSVRKTIEAGEDAESVGIYRTNTGQIAMALQAGGQETVITVELYTTDGKQRDSQTKTLSSTEDTIFLFPNRRAGDFYYFVYRNESGQEATITGQVTDGEGETK